MVFLLFCCGQLLLLYFFVGDRMSIEDSIDRLFNEVRKLNTRLTYIEQQLSVSQESEFEIVKRQVSKLNKTVFDSKYSNTGLLHKLQ